MILESFNGKNLKILYNPVNENLLIGELIKIINRDNSGIIGQIQSIESSEAKNANNIANVQILFSIAPQNHWIEWQGNIPPKENNIQKVTVNELLVQINGINNHNLISLGSLSSYNNSPNYIDTLKLAKPTLVFCDKQNQKLNLLNLLAQELSNKGKKTVILDFMGEFPNIPSAITLEVSKDIKLPLNSKGMELIYQKTLKNISIESRAVIEDIFMEVQEYADNCEQGFIPFSSFREVVDGEYKNSEITELIILKNNLAKLEKQGIFANESLEIESLKMYLEKCNLIIVDFSNVNHLWHKDFLEFIVNSNISNNQSFFMLFEAKDNNIDNELIDKLFVQGYKSGISPIVSVGYNSQFTDKLNPMSQNTIFCTPDINSKISSAFQTLLKKLNPSEFLAYGDISNNIPLFINLNNLNSFNKTVNQQIQTNTIEKPKIQNMVEDYVYHINSKPETNQNLIPQGNGFNEQQTQEFEYDSHENFDNPLIDNTVEVENFEYYQQNFDEDIEIEYPQQDLEEINYSEEENNIIEKQTSYIDEDNYFEQTEYNPIIQSDYNEPEAHSDIPIYSADNETESESKALNFQEGDKVIHQKYGKGVIKKIIGYGNKFLFSINFENFGKKLLDPELAAIEKA